MLSNQNVECGRQAILDPVLLERYDSMYNVNWDLKSTFYSKFFYRIVLNTMSHYIHIMRTETRIIQEVVLRIARQAKIYNRII